MVTLAFYQPDIAGNFGAGLRLAACLGLDVDLIEPCGFALDDRKLKRVAMDYGKLPSIQRFANFTNFLSDKRGKLSRIVLLSRHATGTYLQCRFAELDTLLVGRETSGVPQSVFDAADMTVTIPMVHEARSLNVINALAMVAGEALRQTGGFPASSQPQE